MAFTRFHDDPARISKYLQEIHNIEEYNLNVPGNGLNPLYMQDPYIRMQKWGGNLLKNNLEIQENLMGINRPLNRDCVKSKNYNNDKPTIDSISYPEYGNITHQPRASHPAWLLRDLEINRSDILFDDPQKYWEIPFECNLYSRIIEKDNFENKNNN